MPQFVHLHCHTEYSLLDGAIRLDDLIHRAKDFGMPAAAITDHGVMYGCATFYEHCLKEKLKPILGCEVYVTRDHLDKTSEFAKVRHHLILLAQNVVGYRNLCKLVTAGCVDGYHYKPRVDKGLLRRYNEGIIALSACVAGEIPRTLFSDNKLLPNGGTDDDVQRILEEYCDIYPERFYLEVQANNLPMQAELNRRLIKLARKNSIPLVATNDCHYLEAADADAHDVLLAIQTQRKVQDKDRFRFEARDLYYKSSEEMAAAFPDLPEAIENTVAIADQCDLMLDLKTYYFPTYPLPEGMTMADEFVKLAREGLEKRLDAHPNRDVIDRQVYRDRLEREIKVILDMKFPDYFLIVQNFINWAKNSGIPVGPGRGSAAGSVVAWSLRITNLDPLPYNLLFERFLNSERVSMPDIDVDFCEDRRAEVIQYMVRTYGKDNVAQIAAFGKMKAKAVVKDVARAMDIPFAEANRIAGMIPSKPLDITLRQALEMEPDFKALYQNDPQVHELIDVSLRLEGLARHASTHAAGLVVSPRPMNEFLPLVRNTGNSALEKTEIVTQYDKKMVEKVGLVKFDFLGLRTMTLLHNAIANIRMQGKEAPDLDTLPTDDAETYELISRGDTEAVFQLESSGMRQYLRQLRPSCFEDVIAMLALYRPGPMDLVPDFIRRKHGEIPVEYPLPQLEACLKDTYGVIVYQEQVMQIAQIVGGYSLGGADLLRRAMGKKDAAAMAEQRGHFVEGAIANGIDGKQAGDVFDLVQKFASYGFNKSHAAAYALVTYHTAYLKCHFKTEYMSAVLTSEIGNQEHILKYIALCRDMGIPVLKPDVNISRRDFTPHGEAIIYGFGGIKNIGDEAISEIIAARDKDGNFQSLYDLCIRVNTRKVTKRVLESLIKSGACDGFGATRNSLLAAVDAAVAKSARKARDNQSNQASLLAFAPVQKQARTSGIGFSCDAEGLPEWDDAQKLKGEKDALGFFLTSHPLQPYHPEINRLGLLQLEDAREMGNRSPIRTGVLITGIKEHLTKKNQERMAFITVEDLTANAEVTIFPKDYAGLREFLQKAAEQDMPVLLTAEVDNPEGRDQPSKDDAAEDGSDDDEAPQQIKLRGLSAIPLDDACRENEDMVTLEISSSRLLAADGVPTLKTLLERHRGPVEVQFIVMIDDTRCIVQPGPQWTVAPGPGLYHDLTQWNAQDR